MSKEYISVKIYKMKNNNFPKSMKQIPVGEITVKSGLNDENFKGVKKGKEGDKK